MVVLLCVGMLQVIEAAKVLVELEGQVLVSLVEFATDL